MTLIEELEQARQVIDELRSRSTNGKRRMRYRELSDRLQKRIEHIERQLREPTEKVAEAVMWSTNNYEIYRGDNIGKTLELIREALTGDL